METLLVECIKEKGTNISENGWTSVIKGGINVKIGDKISVEGIAINAKGVASNTIEITSDELPGGFAPNKFAFSCSYYINDNAKYNCHLPTNGTIFQPNNSASSPELNEISGFIKSSTLGSTMPWKLASTTSGAWAPTDGERPTERDLGQHVGARYGYLNHTGNYTKSQPLYLLNTADGQYITRDTDDEYTENTYALKTDVIPFEVNIGYDTPANIADTLNDQFHNTRVNLPSLLTEFNGLGIPRYKDNGGSDTAGERLTRESNFVLKPSNGVINNISVSMNSSDYWLHNNPQSAYNHNLLVSQPEKYDATARLCKRGDMIGFSDIPSLDAAGNPEYWRLPEHQIYRLCSMPLIGSQVGSSDGVPDTFDLPNNLLIPLNLLFTEFNVKHLSKLLQAQKWYQGNPEKSTVEEFLTDTDRWVSGIAMNRWLECSVSGFPPDNLMTNGVFSPLWWVFQQGGNTNSDNPVNVVRPPIKSYFPAWTHFSDSWYDDNVFPPTLTTEPNRMNLQTPTNPILKAAKVVRLPSYKALLQKYNAGIQAMEVTFANDNTEVVCCLIVKGQSSTVATKPYDERAFYRVTSDVRPIGTVTGGGPESSFEGTNIFKTTEPGIYSTIAMFNYNGNTGAFAPMCHDTSGYASSKSMIISPFLVQRPPGDFVARVAPDTFLRPVFDPNTINTINTEVDLSIGAPNPTITYDLDTNRFEISNLHWSATKGVPNMNFLGDAAADASLPAVFINRAATSDAPIPVTTVGTAIRNAFFVPWKSGYYGRPEDEGVWKNECYHQESGISIENILLFNNGTQKYEVIDEIQFKNCLLDKMGFAYSDLVTDKRIIGAWAPRCNFIQGNGSNLLTTVEPQAQMALIQSLPSGTRTNFEMDSELAFGLDAATNGNNMYGLGGAKKNPSGFSASSSRITATSIPSELANPFWLIYSDIINGITFIGPDGHTANIVATIGREYLSGDYSYAFDAGYTFTATQNFTLTQIRTAILDPEFKKTDIGSNSIVIYKIERPITALQLAANFSEPKYKK